MTRTLQFTPSAPGFGEPGALTPRLRPHLVGGRIVEWELRDAERVAGASHRWGEGVSFLQSDHLATMADKRTRGEDHTGFLTAATRFDVPLDQEAMSRALTDFVRRHEELRAHYRAGPTGPERWVAPPECFEIVVADRTPVVVGDAELGAFVGRRASESARAELIPGSWWGAATADDGFTFFVATDHAHGDGYSSALALIEIATLYRAHAAGETAELAPAGTFGEAVLDERAAAAALDSADQRLDVWRNALVANDGRAPRCPLELGLTDENPQPGVALEQWLLDPAMLAACDNRIASDGGSFAGLLYAALATRHRELTGESQFFVSTVLATRGSGHQWTQGWLCNFAPIVVAVPDCGDASFDDLVRAATDSVRVARRAATVPAHAVLAKLAAEGVFRGLDGSPYMVSYTDLGRLPVGDDPALPAMQTFSGVGATRNANLWFTRTEAGLVVRSHVPDNEVARASIVEHLARVGAILTDYARDARSAR
ncbi:acyltransferase [Gordonia sp. zg691]|uniref:Acyltransferase n=1 Tax=Gordonia jinghuaiqii TaxID=2758710 RepID=A0A7D7R115_9ACTN|nr:condensation domain-containing protein [Gordonia jinghuaiqii]MBD0861836.1 acyltransferase [Gordonia jinghuaiqii]MCR5977728.1 acyltransferase [Gordonia jinghuaiqii]QMT02391.1 acyltransferase [Gordonia jinghuaiqii]